MAWIVAQFFVSAIIIVVSGTYLSRHADTIADLTGLGRLLVGSILLAGATSLPELSVDLTAVRIGEADMAVGDLLGSSLFNLLILGILDLSHQSRGRMLSRASVAHALPATLGIALTSIVAISILLGPKSSWSFAGLGIGSWMVLVTYALGVRMVYYDQRFSAERAEPIQEPLFPDRRTRLIKSGLGFTAAALVIVATAPWLAGSAAEIADRTGLGGTFIGTTLVALCTSLPELVSSMAALRMGAPDMAIGNIFGSNAFNMVLLIALDLVQPGALLSCVSTTHILTALATILVTAVAVLGQLYHVERRRVLLEPDGALVVGLIIAALALVYYTG